MSAFAAYDAETLAALAGEGLLRRAQKDLDAGKVARIEHEPLSVLADGQTVRLDPLKPERSACTCPAAGWCKHRVAAILLLRAAESAAPSEQAVQPDAQESEVGCGERSEPHPSRAAEPPATAPAATPASRDPLAPLLAELDSLDLAAVLKAAGAPARRRLPRLLAQISGLNWSGSAGSIALQLAGLDTEVRYLKHGGYAGMVSEGPVSARPALHLAALWAYWQARGRALPRIEAAVEGRAELVAPEASAPDDPAEAADVLAPLIDAVQQAIAEWLDEGLGQLSPYSLNRLAALAVDARADALPALAGRLRTLLDLGRRLRARDDRLGESEVLIELALLWAWCVAMRSADGPARERLGGGASRYQMQSLDRGLLVAGAEWWTRPSGARGLTVYLWDAVDQRLRRVALARADDRDPSFYREVAWSGSAIWPHLGSAERLVGAGALQVKSARLNPAGDLAPGEIDAEIAPPWREADRAPGLSDWREIPAVLTHGELFQPRPRVLLLAPHDAMSVQLDERRQCWVWPLVDAGGRILPLCWPVAADDEARMLLIEQLGVGAAPRAVLVVQPSPAAPWLKPVSLLSVSGGNWICHPLQFTQPRRPKRSSTWTSRIRELLTTRQAPPLARASRIAEQLLQPLEARIQRAVSLGEPDVCGPEAAALARQLDDAGLPRLAVSLRAWAHAGADGLPPHDVLLRLALLLEQLREGLALQVLVGQGADLAR
ncbi:MAG: hypothetical protein MUE46_10035 [Xanthomonadales bacterium]|jgi:hypothetical protein|nr:hypothetical protein [Xanthomonadales bacterium]